MLSNAVIENNVAIVKFLIENGEKVLQGEHPLHIAVANDNCEMVEVLLPVCDIGDLDDDRRTPLHLVCSRKMAILLLRHGASVDARDAYSACPYETTTDESARKLLLHRYCELHPEDKIAAAKNSDAMVSSEKDWEHRFTVEEITMQDLIPVEDSNDSELAKIRFNNCEYRLSRRFLSSFARKMKFELSFFGLFSPQEIITRAAERYPGIAFKATFDNHLGVLLGVVEPDSKILPAHIACKVIADDPRTERICYRDGIWEAEMMLDEKFEVPFAGKYRRKLLLDYPVDGLGKPCIYLASIREACNNVSVAMSKQFRTDIEVNDELGTHLQKLLKSFNNDYGFSVLDERLITAQNTPASVSELLSIDALIAANVIDRSAYRKIHDRLNDIAGDPCYHYEVTSLKNIHCNEQKMIPIACSVNDLLNFCSELTTHYGGLIRRLRAFHEKTGEILGNCFDLEAVYPRRDKKVPDFFLKGLDLDGNCVEESLESEQNEEDENE
ncbi:MAG: ankyrin repeat domain-containing protein [Lentisphaeria bacterium]|nr:ankyrin repeat domain-containing protein [Lentisphaeria bacterium]